MEISNTTLGPILYTKVKLADGRTVVLREAKTVRIKKLGGEEFITGVEDDNPNHIHLLSMSVIKSVKKMRENLFYGELIEVEE
jgi:hypothetical protein